METPKIGRLAGMSALVELLTLGRHPVRLSRFMTGQG